MIVIKPQFDSAADFSDGRAFVRYPDREKPKKPGETSAELIAGAGFIDETGKVVIELESPFYLAGDGFSEGLTKFWTWESGRGNLYGYIDTSGKVKIKPRFSYAYEFVDGLCAVCINQKCGFINKTGEFVIAAKYRVNAPFSDGMAIVGLDINTIGFVDRTGEMVIAPQFGYMVGTGFREGLSVAAYPWGKYGYIDKQGVIVIPMQFDFAQPFSEGLAAVSMKDKWGYIDKTGKFAIEPQFRGTGPFSEGLAPVGGDFGAVGIDEARTFNEPPTGYIDKTGKMVIALKFERAGSFTNGVARVYVDSNKLGYIELHPLTDTES
jgi:hypothetical protein